VSKCAVRVINVNKSFTTMAETDDGGLLKRRKKITKHILKDVNLDIKKGEVFGIIGRNGSGKSTTLNMISKIMKPDSGTIEINGKVASILELGMGFHNDLTGRENIYIKGTMYGLTRKQLDARLDNIVDYADIGEYIDLPMRVYSSGMRSRVAFSIMISVDADIIILDEVLATGDLAFNKKSRTHFSNLKLEGKTIILVAHSMSTMREMCDRVAWLDNGVIREVGPSNVVCGHYETELAESIDILTELAESGVPASQNTLGCMYRDGHRVEKDMGKAKYWFEEAAKRNYDIAKVNLADIIVTDEALENIDKAMDLYMSAAGRGNREARTKLSRLLTNESRDISMEVVNDFKELLSSANPQLYYEYADLILKTAWNNEGQREAFLWFEKASDYGHATAMYQIALMYRDGTGISQSDSEYINWLKKAARCGHAYSQLMLGNAYRDGIKVDHDIEEAFIWYKMAADNNNLDAIYQVAMMYRKGTGIHESREESDYWLKLYAQHGLNRQINILADSYANNKNGVFDIEKGKKWYAVNAEHGYGDSKYRLGNILNSSEDMDERLMASSILDEASKNENFQSTVQLFNLHALGEAEKSNLEDTISRLDELIEKGNMWSANTVGNIFADAKILEFDGTKSIEYLEKAAESNIVPAVYRLGIIYRDGILVEADYSESLKWFKKGALLKHVPSAISIVNMYLSGVVNQAALDYALKEIEKICRTGNTHAIRTLGEYYLSGKVVEQNFQKAIYWYSVGSNLGDIESRYQLGLIYRDGKGVEKSFEEALKWFSLSAKQGDFRSIIAIIRMYGSNHVDKNSFDSAFSQLIGIAKGGHRGAMRDLGNILYEGKLVSKDLNKSKIWFERAAMAGCNYSREKLESLKKLEE